MAITSAQIIPLLTDILGESPTSAAANAASYIPLTNTPAYSTIASLASYVANSLEAGIAQQVARLYEGVLGRAPDAAGLTYWVGQAELGLTPQQISQGLASVPAANFNSITNQFLASPEFKNNYGGASGSILVAILYQNVLGRAPDLAGQAYWTNQLIGGASVASVVQGIVNSPENTAKLNGPIANFLIQGALADTGNGPQYPTGGLPLPTFTVATTTAHATEGSTVTFTVTDANVTGTATVPYTISGVNAAQVVGGAAALSGNLTLTGGTGTITIPLTSGANLGLSGNLTATIAPTTTGATGTFSVSVPLTETSSQVLTTGTDSINISGGTITGSVGGTSATLTSGDSITATGTGNVFNLSDAGTGGQGTPTAIAGVTVSGVQTLNLSSAEGLAIDVSSTGTQGYTGLTALTVNAFTATAANGALNNTIKAQATTAINAVYNAVSGATNGNPVTGGTITVNGGSTVALTENTSNGTVNSVFTNGGITVNGGSGTTSVSVTQTAATAAATVTVAQIIDAPVTIVDNSTTASTITSVTLANYGNASISSTALTSLSLSGTSGALTINDTAAAVTTLNLFVNNVSHDTFDANNNITDVSTGLTKLNITVGASKSSIGTFAGFPNVVTETIAGSSTLTQNANGLSKLASITVSGAAGLSDSGLSALPFLTSVTSTSSGTITISLNDSVTSFTGSTGRDIITVGGPATKAITAGTATNNELVWNAAAPSALTNITGFTVLGTNGSSSGTFDMTQLTTFTSFDAQDTTGTVVFKNVPTNAPLSVDGGANSVTYKTVDTSGPADNVSIPLGSKNGINVGTLALSDSSGNGVGTVTLTTSGNQGTITNLNDANLSSLTIAGSSALTIANITMDTATSLTIVDNNSNTSANVPLANGVTIIALTDASLQNLTLSGSGAAPLNITTFTDALNGAVTINDALNSAVTFSNIALANATSISITNSGASTLSINTIVGTSAAPNNSIGTFVASTGPAVGPTGSLTTESFGDTSPLAASSIVIASHAEPSLTSLTLAGNVTDTETGIATTTGVTVSAATDNAPVSVSISALGNGGAVVGGAAAGQTDNITLGNGNNGITDVAIAGTVNVTVGSGSNVITLGSATTTNTTGQYFVTLATHTGKIDQIVVGNAGTFFSQAPDYTINGMATNDILVFSNSNTTPVAPAAGALTATGPTLVATLITLETAITTAGNGGVAQPNAYAIAYFGGNTFIAHTEATIAALANVTAANIELVEITGVHTFAPGILGGLGHLTLMT